MTDVFTVSSLKLIKNNNLNAQEFLNISPETRRGNIFHALISAYLKDFDIEKLELALESEDLAIWKIHKNSEIMQTIKNADRKFIEQPFFIKETALIPPFYLSGRLDAVINHEGKYIIFDWKTENLPKNPENDIQTIVYMHCVSKLFKTKNIQMKYCSIKEQKIAVCNFSDDLSDRICSIIKKYNVQN